MGNPFKFKVMVKDGWFTNGKWVEFGACATMSQAEKVAEDLKRTYAHTRIDTED